MNGIKWGMLSVLALSFLDGFGQSSQEAKKIESLIANSVRKVMPSSVYIIEYDTLKNKVQEGVDETNGFTGVVVSADGHILTASHAAMPNQVYQIRFPNGTRQIGIGLGRIGIQDKGTDFDMAMVKIIKPGRWPFAVLAPSSELRLHQPVISISYPNAFFKQTPNVRFGRISDVDFTDGFIESSAKMEPGDSGGPLFDGMGRVVGIHSWIKEHEKQNYDVPADHFLRYWTALNVARDYKELPAADDLPATALPVRMDTVSTLEDLVAISPRQSKSVVLLASVRGEQQLSVLGTVIEFGPATYILSKSSMVINSPMLKSGERSIPVHIICRDKENDLVLLKAVEKLESGIFLKQDTKDPGLAMKDLGTILISALANGSKTAGILSAVYTDLPLMTSRGYLGAGATYADGKITLGRIGRGSTHATPLRARDQVTAINEVRVNSAADYNRELAMYMAGDSVTLDIIRDSIPMRLGLYLGPQPTVRHVSFEYAGGRSARSDGFEGILVQDASIKADECGGPVFNTAGEFYGINIARRSRTSTIIMPVGGVAKFIQRALNNNRIKT